MIFLHIRLSDCTCRSNLTSNSSFLTQELELVLRDQLVAPIFIDGNFSGSPGVPITLNALSDVKQAILSTPGAISTWLAASSKYLAQVPGIVTTWVANATGSLFLDKSASFNARARVGPSPGMLIDNSTRYQDEQKGMKNE